MQYAAPLPQTPSRRTIIAPLVALAVGAATAVGAYALIDDNAVPQSSSRVIVVDAPAQPSQGVAAKNEAGVAFAVAGSKGAPVSQGTAAKNEAGVASAVAGTTADPISEGVAAKNEAGVASAVASSGVELRGSTASRSDTTSQSGQADTTVSADPHSTAVQLRR